MINTTQGLSPKGSNSMDAVRGTVFQVARWTLVLNCVAGAVGAFFIPNPVALALGLIFGAAIGLLNFYELELTLSKSVKMSPGNATQYASLKYFARFLITAIVLFVAIRSPYLNVLGTAFGLVSIKFVVFALNLLNKK